MMAETVTRADGATEQAMSRAVYDAFVDQQGMAARSVMPDAPNRMRLWDMVDGTSMMMDAKRAMSLYLRMVTNRCTACTEASPRDGDVENHIRNVAALAAAHEKAETVEVTTPNGTGLRCTACQQAFISRPLNAAKHIRKAKDDGPKHIGAKVILINRYSLTPPVQIPGPTLVEPASLEPETRQVERTRRRRRHRRGKEKVRA